MVISDCFKTQEMCNETVHIESRYLTLVPNILKTEGMCDKAVSRDAYTLKSVPDHFMTQKMCNKAMCEIPAAFFLFLTILKQYKCVSRLLK